MRKPNQNIFSYMGNKTSIVPWIVSNFPPHNTYIDVFGGSGAVLVNKPISLNEVYNDFNPLLSNFFHIIRTRGDEFMEQLDLMIMSEKWYNDFYTYLDSDYDDSENMKLENALRYFYIMTLCHRGKFNGGYAPSPNNKAFIDVFKKKKEIVRWYIERFKNVVIHNRSFEFMIKKYGKKEDNLLYLDPPYVNTETYYKALAGEFNLTQHIGLRDMLSNINSYFFLSYEDHEIVRELYKDFVFIEKNKHSHGRKKSEDYDNILQEVLITNYNKSNKLFSHEKLQSGRQIKNAASITRKSDANSNELKLFN